MQANTYASPHLSRPTIPAPLGAGWVRRWWPVLVPTGFSLACAVVLAVQQQEIRALKQALERQPASVAPVPPQPAAPAPETNAAPTRDTATQEQEIARLKALVGTLTGEISELERLRTENQGLRAKLSAADTGLSAEELDALAKAKERAQRIVCINNMKQLGLSVRLWAADHGDRYPQDIVCMSNEMSSPKILICPGDQSHVAASNFGAFTPANCSYEWFLNPPGSDTEPSRVVTRCPIHGNIGLYDGSVQSIGADHPEQLIQRDGKLYYEPSAQP